ncbi:MAG: histidinol dehydrogenase [Pyrinomonadaceae bacterium]
MLKIIGRDQAVRRRERLAHIKSRSVALDAELLASVGAIISDVRQRGDAALVEYTEKFDGVRLTPEELRADLNALRASAAKADGFVREALREAIRRVRVFHRHERAESWEMQNDEGLRLGQRVSPVEIAGLYVPGGTASYPSSVVMNVVPAQVAGVRRIVVVTPPGTLAANPAVAAALVELGVTEVYSIGGAQAVAALAYGTETVPRVDKITGPGNKWVAAAKKLVFGAVGIDSIAGPSEVVIIANETARADFVAADLLAQAEHGADASAVLVTTSERLAREVAAEVERQTATLPRRAIIAESLKQYGAAFVVADLTDACALVNELAPEHLEIVTRDDDDAVAAQIRHAGAIFFGPHTPEAVGDYFAGPNHVLPTGGAARFSSALGVHDFTRRTTMLRYTANEINRTAQMITALARAEGLDAHSRSVSLRMSSAPDAERVASIRNPLVPIRNPIKLRVRDLRAYTLSPDRASVKLNQNENPWDAPEQIKRETLRRMKSRAWSRYPNFVPASLHEKLAGFAGWTPHGVIAGNGSNELIQATLMTTIGEGRRVLISEPTFALYRQVTTVLGGEVLSVPLAPDLKFDVPALKRAIETVEPDVSILCSPNNPTGCRIEEEDLTGLLEATSGLIVVDEAYFEFARQSAVPLLARHQNLVVFRTFSKAMGLAALRVGYLLAAPELAREIGKAVLPYNLNAFSQTAAEVAIEAYEELLRPLVEQIIGERERLFAGLREIDGLAPVPSQANFMVVRSALEPRRVYRELLARGILIRDVSASPMLSEYFRVSIGTPAENDALLGALWEVCGR